MSERFQATVYGLVLALGIGWTFYIGQSVIVPIVFSVLVVYVIVGLTRVLFRLPMAGRFSPLQLGMIFAEFEATSPIAILLSRNGQI